MIIRVCEEEETAFGGATGSIFAMTSKADNIAFPSSFKSEAGVGTASWVALGAGSWMSSFAPSLTPSRGLRVGGGGVFHCDGEETGSLGALEENRGFLARVGEGFDGGNVQGDGEANSAPPIASDSRAA